MLVLVSWRPRENSDYRKHVKSSSWKQSRVTAHCYQTAVGLAVTPGRHSPSWLWDRRRGPVGTVHGLGTPWMEAGREMAVGVGLAGETVRQKRGKGT